MGLRHFNGLIQQITLHTGYSLLLGAMRCAFFLTAIVSLVVGDQTGCSNSGVIGEGFQCFEKKEAQFQEDAYPAPKKKMAAPPRAYTNRKDSRQAKKIRETKKRSDLNMGEGGDNSRAYKSHKKQKTKKNHHAHHQKHAEMKKAWKQSSSVSGDKNKRNTQRK
jgi:hypothetical protein